MTVRQPATGRVWQRSFLEKILRHPSNTLLESLDRPFADLRSNACNSTPSGPGISTLRPTPLRFAAIGCIWGCGAGFDLAGAGSNCEVGDECVFSFAGAVRNYRGVAVAAGEIDGVQSFADRADLVDFDQDRVGHVLVDSLLQELNIRYEDIVAYQLNLAAELCG